jgi:dihydroorotate dehydrogenase (fumarate)
MLESVKALSSLPVAVKLSPFYTSLSHFTARLFDAGADGLVIFNRFYQPDIDLEKLSVVHQLELSNSSDLLLRLRWLAVLSAQTKRTLAVSGGVHSAPDALKAVLAGAHGVQLVSEILQRGSNRFTEILGLMTLWLEAHGYDSLAAIRGKMNLVHCPDPASYERAAYLHILNACSKH